MGKGMGVAGVGVADGDDMGMGMAGVGVGDGGDKGCGQGKGPDNDEEEDQRSSGDNKDDDDDWVIGGGGGLGFGGETGVLEQTNLLGDTGGCPEDIDGNGTVNIDDLLLVLGNYNGTGEGDVDGNGVVNIDDMLLVIGAWNASC